MASIGFYKKGESQPFAVHLIHTNKIFVLNDPKVDRIEVMP